MTIRIVRFKIADTGNDFTDYETIATSLNKKDFSAEEIKKLYHMRWGIETSFRELKYAVGLTRLHTKKTSAAMQEVLARLIMYNFCECITMSIVIEQKDSRKWTYHVKCFRDQGTSIYHGSNTIYRKYCSEKGKLTSASQLRPGMAVFKWNANTPEKFNDGLGDFQHIGLVVSVNPLRIIHASTGTMCVTTDTSLGKWKYWGWLKDVRKPDSLPTEPTDEGDDEPVAEAEFATVIADSGSTVNMRTKAKSSAPLVERVPLGARVEVLGTCGSWTKVKFGSRTGYMMTKFLTAEVDQEPDEDLTLEERVTRLERRVALLEANDGAVG